MTWAAGKPDELIMLFDQAKVEYSLGKMHRARETLTHTANLAQRLGLKEVAAMLRAMEAAWEAELGNDQEARQEASEALSLSPGRHARAACAIALAQSGDTSQAEKILQELAKEFPLDTFLGNVSLPVARAIVEMQRNNPAKAVTLLEAASPYELGVGYAAPGYWPNCIRGQAYLQGRDGAKAAVEYQKILNHRGIGPTDPLYGLARAGLGRAYALQAGVGAGSLRRLPAPAGHPQEALLQPDALAKARTAYQDFFAFWKDADPDIPILKQAKEEYEKLR
jgi:tetratricopeptide (TPR) repeat protein